MDQQVITTGETPSVATTPAAQAGGVVDDGSILLPLSDGRVAKVRKGKGRDIQRASRVVDMQEVGQMGLIMASCAIKTTIEGVPLTYEDMLELPEEDCWSLMGASQGKKRAFSPRTT